MKRKREWWWSILIIVQDIIFKCSNILLCHFRKKFIKCNQLKLLHLCLKFCNSNLLLLLLSLWFSHSCCIWRHKATSFISMAWGLQMNLLCQFLQTGSSQKSYLNITYMLTVILLLKKITLSFILNIVTLTWSNVPRHLSSTTGWVQLKSHSCIFTSSWGCLL